jgi:hypothetical protein
MDGVNGSAYQWVGHGGQHEGVHWKDAFEDASSRCYRGVQGHLVHIGSEKENEFVLSLHTKVVHGKRKEDLKSAWIGATSFHGDCTFAWTKGLSDEGTVFTKNGTNVASTLLCTYSIYIYVYIYDLVFFFIIDIV